MSHSYLETLLPLPVDMGTVAQTILVMAAERKRLNNFSRLQLCYIFIITIGVEK